MTDLTVHERFPSPQSWESIQTIAEKLKDSKALPSFIDNPGKLVMVLLAGKEAGMGAVEALNSFYIVNGKLTIYGAATLSQLKRAKFAVRWGECSDKIASVTIIAPDKSEHTEVYTIEEAQLAGNMNKNEVWRKYPKNMLRWKALGAAVRFFCPEVLNGYYVREEMDGNGAPTEVIDVESTTEEGTDDYGNKSFEDTLSKTTT